MQEPSNPDYKLPSSAIDAPSDAFEPAGPVDDTSEADVLKNIFARLSMQAFPFIMQQDVYGLSAVRDQFRTLVAWAKANLDPERNVVVEAMDSYLALTIALLKSMILFHQGRFTKSKEELERGAQIGLTAYEKIERLRNSSAEFANDETTVIIQAACMLVGKFARAYMFRIDAEQLGYQGLTDEYLDALKTSVDELKFVDAVELPDHEVVAAVRRMIRSYSDSTETRIEFFEVKDRRAVTYLKPRGDKILIIHGHQEARWRELQTLLEAEFKLDSQVLLEQEGTGRTVIEKFEEIANKCCFAFAVMTADDLVKVGEKDYAQARPNVFFEIGWFAGRFGRSRVVLLKQHGASIPSDLFGVSHLEFHNKISELIQEIRRELGAGAILRT